MKDFWRASFGSAPIDEIRLAEAADRIVAEHAFTSAQAARVLAVCDSLDANTATAVLYRYLVGTRHRDFITELDALPARPLEVHGKTRLLVVPGFFYAEHPDTGAGGDAVLAAGKSCGFEVARVPLNSLGTVTENTAILQASLESEQHPDIWLVSFSKGAAEIRLLMQQLQGAFPANVRGWISISGIVGGTPLATIKFRSMGRRAFNRLFFPLIGTSVEAIRQMRHDHPFWQETLTLPPGLQCIHVTGMPLLSHVQPILTKRYKLLSELGANDGFALLQTTMAVPGHIYPLWGADHFLRTPELSPLLYRLLQFTQRPA